MYIPRIVIDANRINATGKLEGMNRLEEYFKRGLVEIQATTTLSAELKGPYRIEKSKAYHVIGGSSPFITGEITTAMIGAPIHLENKFAEIIKAVTKQKSAIYFDDNTYKDVQHILQAWQNRSDYFVTDERKLQESAPILKKFGIDINILNDLDCLNQVNDFFTRTYNTHDIDDLTSLREKLHPITLGQESCYNFLINDFKETLLQIEIVDGHLEIAANIYDTKGNLQLKIRPSQDYEFLGPDVSVRGFCEGPLRIGQNSNSNFAVYLNKQCVLYVVTLSSGVAQISYARLLNSVGSAALTIDRHTMDAKGIVMFNTQWG